MSIEIDCNCDNCGSRISDSCFCKDCYETLKDRLGEAEDTITELKKEIEKLSTQP